ncbi:YhfT family protein [Clostridium gasigenes]|uniref:YhfT family protein n=1 Tax=Clostridium gasigenes TaxID=94869 RepID=UPI001C0E0D33|nr:YhfT family protein [Clostridium gasigenes]MBU3103577.1 YhfT family protein [Clostridium gasigenes]
MYYFAGVSILMGIICGLAAIITNRGIGVFNDGVRPILPEVINGRIDKKELTKISFDMSKGFIISLGIIISALTATLNPWILFLPTDIIGIYSENKKNAFGCGFFFGVSLTILLYSFTTLINFVGIDLSSLELLSRSVIILISLVPIVVIYRFFGKKKGIVSGVATLIVKIITHIYIYEYSNSITFIFATIILVIITINMCKSLEKISYTWSFDSKLSNKKAILISILSGLLAIVVNIGVVRGSEPTLFMMLNNNILSGAHIVKEANIQGAILDLIRILAFLPFVITTINITGVNSIIGIFTFTVGYVAPNPISAFLIAFLLTLFLDKKVLKLIWKLINTYPKLRDLADVIRTVMMEILEISLTIGGALVTFKTGGVLGITMFILLIILNKKIKLKVMKVVIGPLAMIIVVIGAKIISLV